MNFQTMNKQRKFVLIAAAVGVISMFLPWISVSLFGYTQSENGMHGIGILIFICFLASAGLAYLGDQTKNLDKSSWGIVLAAGAIALISTISFYVKASDSIMGNSLVGFGLYIGGLAAIGVLAAAYMFRSPADSLKDTFDSVKKNIESKINSQTNSAPPNTTDTTNPPVVDNTHNTPENTTTTL